MSNRTFINVDTSVSSAQPGHITGTNVTNGSHRLGLDVVMIDGLDRVHTRTHQGKAYVLSTIVNISGNATNYFLIDTTTTGADLHCGFIVDVAANTRLELFENATVTSNGVAFSPINTNRQSANTPNHKFYYGPTVSDVGSTLTSFFIPGGSGVFASGGVGGGLPRGGAEWILANTKKYLFGVTNLTAGTITAGMSMMFYEN